MRRKPFKCPCCGSTDPMHLACQAGAKGGGSVKGAKKIRGSSSYYSFLARSRRRKEAAAKAAKQEGEQR